MITDIKKLEDECTEFTVKFFEQLKSGAIKEPVEITNARLPELANALAEIARGLGAPIQYSAPTILDEWVEGSPAQNDASTYEIKVKFIGVDMFSIPVLPRGAA